MVGAARGAICVQENNAGAIRSSVVKLVARLVKVNGLSEEDIISVLFSQTKDLTEANPASALREIGFTEVPLFCSQEPDYRNSMSSVIRVLITYNTAEKRKVVPVYLDGAEALRSDIFES